MKGFRLFFTIVAIYSFQAVAFAQEKTAPVAGIGEAPNLVDNQGNKTGLWIEREGEYTWKGEYAGNAKIKTWTAFYNNNFIAKIENYSNGLKDGLMIQCDRKGKISLMENYKDGKLDGLTIYYGLNTDKPQSETWYTNGMKNGLFRQYYENGKIQEETVYRDDKKEGLSRWNNKAGQRIAEYNYKAGNFDGIQKTFYENDTVQAINQYKNNELSGESKEFYRNGKVKLSGNYMAGIKEGNWTEYDEMGKVTRVVRYKNGTEIKK
jgi:antitoxin component YwqK of YwqJK toxin-antitoxin module